MGVELELNGRSIRNERTGVWFGGRSLRVVGKSVDHRKHIGMMEIGLHDHDRDGRLRIAIFLDHDSRGGILQAFFSLQLPQAGAVSAATTSGFRACIRSVSRSDPASMVALATAIREHSYMFSY